MWDIHATKAHGMQVMRLGRDEVTVLLVVYMWDNRAIKARTWDAGCEAGRGE